MRNASALSGVVFLFAAAFIFSACSGSHVGRYYHPPGGSYSKGKLPSGQGKHRKTGNPYTIAGKTYYPLESSAGFDQTGIASWYGRDFHGKLTANGESYDMHALSAAHKTLPLPTLVRVTNLENRRSVVVRVNDRGPFVGNRIIDLSYAAARALGYAKQGTTHVRVQALGDSSVSVASYRQPIASPVAVPASPAKAVPSIAGSRVASQSPVPGMYVQLGAFSQTANANRLKAALSSDYPSVKVRPFMSNMQQLYRVRIGPYSDARNIERTMLMLQQKGYNNAIVVIE